MLVAVTVFLLLGFVFLARDATITEGLRSRLHARAEAFRAPPKWPGPMRTDGVVRRGRIASFLDRMLACAPCVAAWAAPPSAVLAWSLTVLHEYVAAVLFLFIVAPVCGIGLLYGLTVLSPTQALAAFLENRRAKKP